MAISRSLIPQQISKGGKKMPKVGKKHFKYTKEGREKAKKYAKKTGQEIEYMGGGVVNRKYYAMGGKVKKAPSKFIERRKIFSGAKALGKFPFVGRPFRQIAKAGEAASKFIKRRKKLSGAKALKGKK